MKTRRNVAGAIYAEATLLGSLPKPEQPRLRTTWLATLMTRPVPLAVILTAAGLKSTPHPVRSAPPRRHQHRGAAGAAGLRDGRLSNVELAARVGLTPPPCLRRVKRLEAEGVITGYRAVIDPWAAGRAFEVIVAVDIAANDRRTVEEFEAAVVAFDEVIAVRRLFGKPDYVVHVAVTDAEAFQMNKLIGLPAVARAVSHQTMKRPKG